MLKGNFYKNSIIKKLYYRLPFAIQAYLSKIIFKPVFGEDMIISKGVKWYYGDVKFGRGVRIAAESFFSNITVGNYTVFARNFRTLEAVHSYDAFAINNSIGEMVGVNEKMISVPYDIQPRVTYYDQTIIGGDVWIGEYVTLKGGIKIGDGAVIAANSTVTHDVPPYAIVGGSPAKFIKWRLPEDKRKLMMDIRWWDWSKEMIAENYNRLCSFDDSLRDEVEFK